MFDNGEGVPQDHGKAVHWWLRAAMQGNASAQYNLALAYRQGSGVAQDYVEAYKWAAIAETYTSGRRRNKYAALRNALLQVMTPSQSAEGQQRVREWMDAM